MSIYSAQYNPFLDIDSDVVRCEECGAEVEPTMALCETCVIERFGQEAVE